MYALSDADTDVLYAYMKDFWTAREKYNDAEAIDRIVKAYRSSSDEPNRVVPATNIAKLAAPVIAAGKTFSILEFGCASGPLLRFLDAADALDGIKHVGIEPFKPFVDDFELCFPDHRIIKADAEAFIKMTVEDFPEAPFSIFYAAVALCMIPPSLAKACLAKAAELCDEIILYDYVLNGLGVLNEEHTMVFEFLRSETQYYFAHNYPRYFAEIGFEVSSGVPLPHPDGNDGYALIRAVRTG